MTASPDSYTRPAPHACFPAGTRITTRGGFLPIEKIEPGDEVLTHLGNFRTVVETMQRQVDEDLVELRHPEAVGHAPRRNRQPSGVGGSSPRRRRGRHSFMDACR